MLWKDFQRPKRVEIDTASLEPTYGRFTAQPFERGFGTTIGNALRRTLLSSIEGAAITAIQIEGVSKRFRKRSSPRTQRRLHSPGPSLPARPRR